MRLILIGAKMINIVKEHPAFDDIISILSSSLIKLKIENKITKNINNMNKNIIFGAHSRSLSEIERFPKNTIIFNLEKLFDRSQWLTDAYKTVLSKFIVFDYSISNVNYIKMKFNNPNVYHIRLGYDSILENLKQDHSKEDIDVYFYGSMIPRRVSLIDRLKKENINVVATHDYDHDKKNDLIQRSKIILNIHCYLTGDLEIVRILPLLSNSKCVVSELHTNCSIYPELKNSCIFCQYDDIVDKIKEYLNDDNKRYKQEILGYNIIKSFPMTKSLNTILSILK